MPGSREWDSTADRLNCADVDNLDNITNGAMTVTAWNNFDSFGGGRSWLFNKADDDLTNGWIMGIVSSGADIEFTVGWSSSTGGWAWWDSGSLTVPTGQWTRLAISYDGTSTSNNPTMYVNDTSNASPDENRAPSGSLTTDDGRILCLGNKKAASDRYIDGHMCHAQIFNRILTATELKIAQYRPGLFAQDLISWIPLLGDEDPEPDLIDGADATNSGTVSTTEYPANVHYSRTMSALGT